jgi:hypothetical protein
LSLARLDEENSADMDWQTEKLMRLLGTPYLEFSNVVAVVFRVNGCWELYKPTLKLK